MKYSTQPTKTFSSRFLALAIPLAALAFSTAYASDINWSTNATSTSWTTGANWIGAIAPTNNLTTDTAVFGTTYGTYQPDIGTSGTTSIYGIKITTLVSGPGLTLSGTGATLAIGAGGINVVAQTNQQNAIRSTTVQLGASQTWANNSTNSASLVVTGNITNIGNTTPYSLTLGGVSSIYASGVISDGGPTGTTGLIVNSGGSVFLGTYGAAANTFTGGAAVKSGGVYLRNKAALGSNIVQLGDATGTSSVNALISSVNNNDAVTNAVNVVGTGAGGALNIIDGGNENGSAVTNRITYTGAITLTNASVVLSNNGVNFFNIEGGISGTGNVVLKAQRGPATGNVNNNITIQTGGVNNIGTITNAGTGNGSQNIETISSVIGANVTGVIQNSATTSFVLSGTNLYTGPTTVSAGKLQAGAAAGGKAFGTNSAVTLANVSGAVLDLNNFSQTVGSITGGGATGGNVTLGTGTLTTGGDNSSPAAYAGAISGTGGLTKVGSGTQTLSGANTYTGATLVSAGTLTIGATGALGNGTNNTSGVTVSASGAAFNLNGTTPTANVALALNGTGVSSAGALTNSGGTASYGGTVTLGSASSIGGSGDITLSAGLGTDSYTLTKVGTDTLTLSAGSSRTGAVAINAGTVKLGSATALGTTAVTTSVVAGAALDINAQTVGAQALSINGQSSSTVGALTNSGAAGSYAGTVALGSASSIGGTGDITLSNSISGANALTKVGADKLTLTGASNGSTTTTISNGTLQIGSGGTSGLLGSGAVTNNGTLAFNRTDSYGGTVNNAINGSGAVTVNGGTLTLGGTNTYGGTTTVTSGTLVISGTGSVTSNVTVQSGGTIGGAGTITGNLILNSGSHFEFSLTNTLAVNTGTLSFGAGGFGVANLTGLDSSVATGTYQLISGSVNTANLNNLGLGNAYILGGGKSAYFQIASLDLVVVPEPATWGLLAFSLTTVMIFRRRRKNS